jgi:hypothetical protein
MRSIVVRVERLVRRVSEVEGVENTRTFPLILTFGLRWLALARIDCQGFCLMRSSL